MARTRTVDADKLIEAIRMLPVNINFQSQYGGSNYTNSQIEQQIDIRIQGYIKGTLEIFKTMLAYEIEKAAVLHGPCMLCAPKEHDVFPEGVQQ